jgi:hypothetical protein
MTLIANRDLLVERSFACSLVKWPSIEFTAIILLEDCLQKVETRSKLE